MRISPEVSAAPTIVVVSVPETVGGNKAFAKVLASIKTKAQHEPSALRAKRYVPRMSTIVLGVAARGRSKVCHSLAALLKNSARCTASVYCVGLALEP